MRPTPDNPNPPQRNRDGTLRHRIDANCETAFWDPVAGRCLNSGYTDVTRPIGPNGANLTSTGSTNVATNSTPGTTVDPYKTFGGGAASITSDKMHTAFYLTVSLGLAVLCLYK